MRNGCFSTHRLREVDLNLTERCNLECAFCSVAVKRVNDVADELSLPELQALFAEFDRLGVQTVRLVGGEPFVRRDIEQILTSLGAYGFNSSVLTNGTIIKRRHLELIKECGIDVIALSVDGHLAELHDQSRGRAKTFSRVEQVIAICNELGIRHRMMTAITSDSIHYLKEIVKFADEKHSELLNLIVLGLGGAANSSPFSFPTYQVWSKCIVELSQYLAANSVNVHVSILFPHENQTPLELYRPLADAGMLPLLEQVWGFSSVSQESIDGGAGSLCLAGDHSVAILANGDVYGCDLMRDLPEFRAGNVKQQGLEEIFARSSVLGSLRSEPTFASKTTSGPESRNFSCGQCRAGVAHQEKLSQSYRMVQSPQSSCAKD